MAGFLLCGKSAVSDKGQDMNIKKYVFQKAAKNHIPVSGTFELTPRCNLECEMCYIRMSAAEEAAIGSELTADEWLALGKTAADAGMVYLLLTGGEPLIRPDFERIYSGLAELGIILTLNTNGTLMNEKIVRCLEKHPPEKVNVTLYGASSDTYRKVCRSADGYDATIRGIQLLKEAKIPVCINTTYTHHNAADMERIVSFAKENSVPIRMTSYLFPPLRCGRKSNTGCFLLPEEYGRLGAAFDLITMDSERKRRRAEILARIQSLSDIPCGEGKAASCMAGRSALWVTWNGQLLPCGMLPDLGTSLREKDFAQIWAGLDHVMDSVKLPAKCVGCHKKILCPVCVAVTRNTDKVPDALCRYCDSYIAAFGCDRES